MSRFVLVFLFFWIINPLFSQKIGLGEWQVHLPFNKIRSITHDAENIYAATQQSILIYNKEDKSVEYYTKINALSDNDLETIKYDESTGTLIVGYTTGNLDLIQNGSAINLEEIKNATSVIGDKSINEIYTKDKKAYLSCGFGIVVIDLVKQEVKETYILGSGGNQNRVNSITIFENNIYAATADGLFYASETNPFLNDFSSWTKMTSIPNFSKETTEVNAINGYLIVNQRNQISDSIFAYDGSTWTNLTPLDSCRNTSLNTENNRLLITRNDSIAVFNQDLTRLTTLKTYDYREIKSQSAYYDGNKYIVGDLRMGLVLVTQNYISQFILINGPYNNSVHKLESVGGNTWVSTAPVNGSAWAPGYNIDGVYKYEGDVGKWINYTVHEFFPNLLNAEGIAVQDFYAVAANPEDPDHAFLCSFTNGIIEVNDNVVINRYDTNNSALQQNSVHPWYSAKVAAADFDDEGNLWIGNSLVTRTLVVKTKNNDWKSFDCGNEFANAIIDKLLVGKVNKYKWMALEKAILVYNDNETILDESDDEYQVLKQEEGNGNLQAGITALAEDHDGEVWIGTDKGIAVIYSPENIFSGGDYDAQQILIEQDGNVQILLETEIITCIKIDGANRKWIGTIASGVYLLSEDGTTQIHHFTAENSPILTNEIKDIAINELTGEVFIGTSSGIVVYRSDATEGNTKFKDVYAFPNPVEPSYDGLITIKGLMENSDIKITDMAGNVVYITKSLGGQAIWNGLNLSGNKVASGIYNVFMVDEQGKKKFATKILFMN